MSKSGIFLPFFVAFSVGIMLFPIPSFFLNLLLVLNISISLTMLMGCLFLDKAEDFTSLPSLLLLATVFRLSLNVSTTREILSSGMAPELVSSFGDFVVRGNLVVGFVIFFILSLIQFIVISKGAERVAEVSARFALDAMPGRQMSIDADMRSGLLGVAEAREQRLSLARESKLYGALDGAMKFIKGDAIAGIIITIINVIAGFCVGLSMLALSPKEAASRFVLYSVGDGLCSQIPAMLVSLAAGVAVTRVSGNSGNRLGEDVIEQITKEPQTLLLTAVFLAVISFLPGFPIWPFLILSCLFFIQGFCSMDRRLYKDSQEGNLGFCTGVRLEIPSQLAFDSLDELRILIRKVRKNVFAKTGVFIPEIDLLQVKDSSHLTLEIYTKRNSFSVHEKTAENIKVGLEEALLDRLCEFIDDTAVRTLLDFHGRTCEALIQSIIPEQISLTDLTLILKSLLEDKLPIRSMRSILQAIAEEADQEQTRPGLRDNKSRLKTAVRIALGHEIAMQYAEDGVISNGVVLAPEWEELFGEISENKSLCAPSVVAYIVSKIEELQNEFGKIVILASHFSRELLSDVLKKAGVKVGVITSEEVHGHCQVNVCRTLFWINVEKNEETEFTRSGICGAA